MPIAFFDIHDDDGWEPVSVDAADASFYWNDGGFMTDAPVDIAKTFDGAMWASTKVERAFGWRGRRLRPDFTVPTRHHNMRQLMIVVNGEMNVKHGKGDKVQHVGAGEFWVAEPGVAYSMTTGPQGATYLECWNEPMSLLETTWHDDSNWVRR